MQCRRPNPTGVSASPAFSLGRAAMLHFQKVGQPSSINNFAHNRSGVINIDFHRLPQPVRPTNHVTVF